MATCPLCEKPVDLVEGTIAFHGDCAGSFARADLVGVTTEDRYTRPSEFCPHPERWHSEDWDSTESEVTELVGAFVRALQPDLVIETGSAFGFTAEAIGVALAKNKHGVLHTIEIDHDRARLTRERCRGGLPVVVEVMSSLDFMPPGEVGFAWFDSTPALRVAEFMRYYPKLQPGAIVGFHDVAPHQGPLWGEIEQLEEAGKLLPIRLRTPRGVCFAEVVK